MDERTIPREAKHLLSREKHQIVNTQATSFGRTNNVPHSKALRFRKMHQIAKTKTTYFALMNIAEAKHLRHCEMYRIAMLREVQHSRLREMRQITKTQTTSVGRTNHAPRSITFASPRNSPNTKNVNLICWSNEQRRAKQSTYGFLNTHQPNYTCWTNKQCHVKHGIYVQAKQTR